MKKYLLSLGILSLAYIISAQSEVVKPYLQNADSDAITIMWETSDNDESVIEYGQDQNLGLQASGSAETGLFFSRIHSVRLSNLSPATKYYYKARTGSYASEIYHFITPPANDSEASFNLLAMSDMQQDFLNQGVFNDLCQNGVIPYIQNEFGTDLSEELGVVLIPGDLVDVGVNYFAWQNTFFEPAEGLFNFVPVYPVLGNHEANTDFFFKYFDLPNNGTPGFEEHWWHKQYSNVLIIGMDSNPNYQIQEQLDWLQGVLDNACAEESIDFVFAQLHHPFHSELWPAGNADYTGDVIEKLEAFSTSCGKPSIHFYGHTHGYSRGQSQDHEHVMVNVASAGGNIDYWGEYAQIDYEEHTVSMDEYGFVFVEINAGPNPEFTLKRINRGDADNPKPNTIEDLISVRRYNNGADKPHGVFPAEGDSVFPDCIRLLGSEFIDQDNDLHGASQWQVSASCDFSSPIIDSWKQHENWYEEQDLQAGDILIDEEVSGLVENSSYCWRVRYRDRSLAWSDWSEPITFYTSPSTLSANLLVNGNAENSNSSWTVIEGNLEAVTDGECNGTSPYEANHYFAIGGICNDADYGEAYQDVDLSPYAASIDVGAALLRFGGYLSDFDGDDIPALWMTFLDGSDNIISLTSKIEINQSQWTLVDESWAVPANSRKLRFHISGDRNSGLDNDSYMDALFAKINTSGDSCSYFTTPVSTGLVSKPLAREVKIYPNPVVDVAMINMPIKEHSVQLSLTNVNGQIVKTWEHVHPPSFSFDIKELPRGVYLLNVRSYDGRSHYYAKLVKS